MWCSVCLATCNADDDCQLQKDQTLGNARFYNNFQQQHPTAPGKLGVETAYSFVVTTAKQKVKAIGGAQGMEPYTFETPVCEHKKELNRSSALDCLGRGPKTQP